jgi:hypothetical protein
MTTNDFEKICMEYLFPKLIRKREKDIENKDKRILIITDNHKSRVNRKLMEHAQKLKIDFHTIPSHTSHILQPLDRGVNGVFKNEFYKTFDLPSADTSATLRKAIVNASITVYL